MTNIATFNVPMDGLRVLLGLPATMRIVRCHALPNMYAGSDGVRFVVESPDLAPLEDGDEVTIVVPRYTVQGETYRKFEGFRHVRITHEEIAGQVDDGLGTH